jgi:hypothetical protein
VKRHGEYMIFAEATDEGELVLQGDQTGRMKEVRAMEKSTAG